MKVKIHPQVLAFRNLSYYADKKLEVLRSYSVSRTRMYEVKLSKSKGSAFFTEAQILSKHEEKSE